MIAVVVFQLAQKQTLTQEPIINASIHALNFEDVSYDHHINGMGQYLRGFTRRPGVIGAKYQTQYYFHNYCYSKFRS